MSVWRWHIVGLISVVSLSMTGAQNTHASRPALDFSNDPCGSSLVENQLWYLLDGKVVGVPDGSTVQLMLAKRHRRLTVHLVGIALEQKGALALQAKNHVSSLVLNNNVGVLLNADWYDQKPAEITGIV